MKQHGIVAFCVHLLSLSVRGATHGLAGTHTLFLLSAECCSSVDTKYHNFIIHLPVYGHSLFPVWSDSNLATRKHSGLGLWVDMCFHISWAKTSEWFIWCTFKCIRSCQNVFQNGHTISYSTATWESSGCSTAPSAPGVVSFLLSESFREVVILLWL